MARLGPVQRRNLGSKLDGCLEVFQHRRKKRYQSVVCSCAYQIGAERRIIRPATELDCNNVVILARSRQKHSADGPIHPEQYCFCSTGALA